MYALIDVWTDMRNAQVRDNEKAERGEERDQLSTWDARAAIEEALDTYQGFTLTMVQGYLEGKLGDGLISLPE